MFFFFSSRRRHTRYWRDWSSDVCSSDLRIVVGEVRGAEALDMLQALNTGHDGSLTTVHANSPADALRRVETLALMAGGGHPPAAGAGEAGTPAALRVRQGPGRERPADGGGGGG